MNYAEAFQRKAIELTTGKEYNLNELFFVKYSYKEAYNYSYIDNEKVVCLKTTTYGILFQASKDKYFDLISGYEVDINDVEEIHHFSSDRVITRNEVINIFKEVEESCNILAEEEIIDNCTSYQPIKFRPSKGKKGSLKELEEKAKLEQKLKRDAIEEYRSKPLSARILRNY